jgi:hypothetical protein
MHVLLPGVEARGRCGAGGSNGAAEKGTSIRTHEDLNDTCGTELQLCSQQLDMWTGFSAVISKALAAL